MIILANRVELHSRIDLLIINHKIMGFWSKLFGKKSADQAQTDEMTAKPAEPADEDTEESADVSQDESDD